MLDFQETSKQGGLSGGMTPLGAGGLAVFGGKKGLLRQMHPSARKILEVSAEWIAQPTGQARIGSLTLGTWFTLPHAVHRVSL